MAGGLIFVAYAALVLTKPITQDEGVFLAIGKYLSQGQVLYQDIFDHKPPGIHLMLAGLFAIFGTSIWAAKAMLILSVLGSTILVKNISERLKDGSGWYAAGIFAFLMTQFEGYFLIAEPFMLFPLLLATWIFLRANRTWPWLFTAGALLGISVLFKQTAVFSVVPIMGLALMRSKRGLLPVLVGLIAPWFFAALWLLSHGALDQAWHQVVRLTLTEYPAEPITFVLAALKNNFWWTLPIWILAILAWRPDFKHKRLIWALVLLPLPLMFYRHYPHYWVQVLPGVAILAAAVLADIRVRAIGLATIIFCIAVAGGKIGQVAVANWQKLQAQFAVAKELSVDSGFRRNDNKERLLAENQFTAFYFLLPLQPLNKYLYITEITDAEGAQKKTIEGLQRQPDVLVLWPTHERAYAKEAQEFIQEKSIKGTTYPKLGMEVHYLPR